MTAHHCTGITLDTILTSVNFISVFHAFIAEIEVFFSISQPAKKSICFTADTPVQFFSSFLSIQELYIFAGRLPIFPL